MLPKNPAYRSYIQRCIPISLVYVAAVVLASSVIDKAAPVTPLNYVLAALPACAILGWIWAIGRLIIELEDEYLRMLEVRKMMVATAFLLSITTLWGFLEIYAAVAKLEIFLAFPIWCIGLIVGQIANRFQS
jgi:hypothetical protein